MKKIKVLAVMTDYFSPGHFRLGWPCAYIRDVIKDEAFEITIVNIDNLMVWDMISIGSFDILHFNRYFGYLESVNELFPMIKSHGVKIVMDIDDHWNVPDEFPAKEIILESLGGDIDTYLNIFNHIDYVTTTTEDFKEVLLEKHNNVTVLPNAIDMSHKMWQFESKPSDVVRIAWLGSNQRHHDLLKLKNSIDKLYADPQLKGKFTFTQYGGEKVDNEIFEGEGFIHLPQLPPYMYGSYYSGVDVCLAPLKDNLFNKCKSELKMVETGMNKKAFVCQNFGVYTKYIVNGENGVLVGDDDDWYTPLKKIILDKEYREKLGIALNDLVKDKFSMEVIARQRVEFYKSICKDEELV